MWPIFWYLIVIHIRSYMDDALVPCKKPYALSFFLSANFIAILFRWPSTHLQPPGLQRNFIFGLCRGLKHVFTKSKATISWFCRWIWQFSRLPGYFVYASILVSGYFSRISRRVYCYKIIRSCESSSAWILYWDGILILYILYSI